MLKLHDDPTMNESKIIVFLKQVWWVAGKRKDFEWRKEKNENEGMSYSQLGINENMCRDP